MAARVCAIVCLEPPDGNYDSPRHPEASFNAIEGGAVGLHKRPTPPDQSPVNAARIELFEAQFEGMLGVVEPDHGRIV